MSDELNQILDAADKFQKQFIDPALTRMDEKLDAHLVKQEDILKGVSTILARHDTEIAALKSNQSRFIKGAAVYASVVGCAVGAGYGWLKSHFRIS